MNGEQSPVVEDCGRGAANQKYFSEFYDQFLSFVIVLNVNQEVMPVAKICKLNLA